jgi:hypothetical protein
LAFVVYNRDLDKVQILEVTQSTIQRELTSLEKDKDWGDLKEYDIEIERTGNDKNTTKYRVTPKPKSPLPKELKEGLPVLEALYLGVDPFAFNPEATESLSEAETDKMPF